MNEQEYREVQIATEAKKRPSNAKHILTLNTLGFSRNRYVKF